METQAVTLSEAYGHEELCTHRAMQAAGGLAQDCLQVWVALPDETPEGGAITCVHSRTVTGPPGTVEAFVRELDVLVRRFGGKTGPTC